MIAYNWSSGQSSPFTVISLRKYIYAKQLIKVSVEMSALTDEMHRKCVYRHLKGEDIQSLNLKNLMGIEHAIEHGLDKVRDHQAYIHLHAFIHVFILYS